MILQDSIDLTHVPPSPTESLLVFHITGNPGLIEYYRTFLTLCFDGLRDRYPDQHIKVTGTSLCGFEVQREHQHSSNYNTQGPPYDLEQQIEHVALALERAIESHRAAKPAASSSSPSAPMRVVLMGHSMGSYILLEVLRRRKSDPPKSLKTANIIGGICLFPTVTHIAKSPSGKKISLLFTIPHFPMIVGVLARILFSWIPFTILQRLVILVTGHPFSASATTTAFLKTPGGVRQALYLASDEMKTITTDTWDDELWGVVSAEENHHDSLLPATPSRQQDQQDQYTKLYFYFGTNDHWVADETRDELIAARASYTCSSTTTEEKENAQQGNGRSGSKSKSRRPIMEIDHQDTPHGFCIEHNTLIARKVVEQYMAELMGPVN